MAGKDESKKERGSRQRNINPAKKQENSTSEDACSHHQNLSDSKISISEIIETKSELEALFSRWLTSGSTINVLQGAKEHFDSLQKKYNDIYERREPLRKKSNEHKLSSHTFMCLKTDKHGFEEDVNTSEFPPLTEFQQLSQTKCSCIHLGQEKTKYDDYVSGASNYKLNQQSSLISVEGIIDDIKDSDKLSVCASCRCFMEATETLFLLQLLEKKTSTAGEYECEICTFRTIRKEEFCQHFLDHLKNEEAYCIKCRNEVNKISREALFASRDDKCICESTTCEESTQPRLSIKTPLSELTPPRCGRCEFVFDYFMALVHKIVETKIKGALIRYVCHVCNFEGVSWNDMEKHVITHIDSKDVLCKNCKQL